MLRLGLGIALAFLVSACLAACGGGDDQPRPPGPLADALAEIGGGGEHGSLGVGWTEPRLAREAGLGRRLMADALGPNAESTASCPARDRAIAPTVNRSPCTTARRPLGWEILCGDLTYAVSSWPRSRPIRNSCWPIAPVAPRMNRRMALSS